jgi:hypothetical protein
MGGVGRWVMVEGRPQAKTQDPTQKITNVIKGWGHGSSARAMPAKQACDSEFKPL